MDNQIENLSEYETMELTRRKMLRLCLRGVVGGFVATGILYAASKESLIFEKLLKPTLEAEKKDAAIKEAHIFLQRKYGITISLEDSWHPIISSDPTSLEQYRNFLANKLIPAIVKYPPNMLKKRGLHFILRGNLKQFGQETTGLQYLSNVVVLDILKSDVSLAIPHEIYHSFDRYRSTVESVSDKFWYDINIAACGHSPYLSKLIPVSKIVGKYLFARPYGMTDEFEDRATYAEMLFRANPEEFNRIIKFVGEDPQILSEFLSEARKLRDSDVRENKLSDEAIEKIFRGRRRKILYIFSQYSEWSVGVMNVVYWHKMINGKIGVPPEAQKVIEHLLRSKV